MCKTCWQETASERVPSHSHTHAIRVTCTAAALILQATASNEQPVRHHMGHAAQPSRLGHAARCDSLIPAKVQSCFSTYHTPKRSQQHSTTLVMSVMRVLSWGNMCTTVLPPCCWSLRGRHAQKLSARGNTLVCMLPQVKTLITYWWLQQPCEPESALLRYREFCVVDATRSRMLPKPVVVCSPRSCIPCAQEY